MHFISVILVITIAADFCENNTDVSRTEQVRQAVYIFLGSSLGKV